MPRRTIHTLTWSSENNAYELATQAQPSQHFGVEDEHSWLDWLATHTSFLFQGRAGSLISLNLMGSAHPNLKTVR
jgi:LuxR family transcriptional regulator, maltose regulon positive regulatory protein